MALGADQDPVLGLEKALDLGLGVVLGRERNLDRDRGLDRDKGLGVVLDLDLASR
jgi:hypothetical protein